MERKEGDEAGRNVETITRGSKSVHYERSHKIIEILHLTTGTSSSSEGDADESDANTDLVSTENERDKDIQIKALALFQAQQATNREAFGTWNRPLDFTLTLIGYIIGIHNFFRFPHLCYKYGTLTFLIPYSIMMVAIGVPSVFMECTIGQYYGVGSITAFRHLAPIITGVSYILAWNSFINCWMYGCMLTWMRSYSADSLSCLKGWVGCHEDHYYNTPYCWTGVLDMCCENAEMEDYEILCPFPKTQALGEDSIYFNYKCLKIQAFCQMFGWTYVPGKKECVDVQNKNKTHSIYSRRYHAAYEYFYGYVLGMRKSMSKKRKAVASKECEAQFQKKCSNLSSTEKESVDKVLGSEDNVKESWSEEGQRLQVDPESSSSIQLPTFAFTTVLFITFFLFDNLLLVSAYTYVINLLPFLILVYLTILALQFSSASRGIQDMFSCRGIMALSGIDVWIESIIQVLVTTGVGNGALISLSSFNKYHHRFLFDVIFVILLNMVTSILATVICFCTIGHYLGEFEVSATFERFINLESHYSSLEFAYIVYSHFLTKINEHDISTLLFFFCISSFPTDTAIRLAQNVLDATVQILPRLKFHSTMALFGVSVFYLLTLLPVTRNGGVVLFMEFEYFALYYAIPIITIIEMVCVGWVYKASKVMDNAEQLGVVSHPLFRSYFIFSLKYATPVLLLFVVISNLLIHSEERFRSVKSPKSELYTSIFGFLFCLTPILLFLLSVLKQLAAFPKSKWKDLLRSAENNNVRKSALLRRKARLAKFKKSQMPRIGLNQQLLGSEEFHIVRKDSKKEGRKSGNHAHVTIDHPTAVEGTEEVILEEVPLRSKQSDGNVKRKSTLVIGNDEVSIASDEMGNLKSYLFWHEVMTYIEDWPDRLDDTEVESEGSSLPSSDDERYLSRKHVYKRQTRN